MSDELHRETGRGVGRDGDVEVEAVRWDDGSFTVTDVSALAAAPVPSEGPGLREALTEWQHIATDLSDALIAAGGHPVGKHESPQQYDSMSSLACTAPGCVAALAAPALSGDSGPGLREALTKLAARADDWCNNCEGTRWYVTADPGRFGEPEERQERCLDSLHALADEIREFVPLRAALAQRAPERSEPLNVERLVNEEAERLIRDYELLFGLDDNYTKPIVALRNRIIARLAAVEKIASTDTAPEAER